MKSKQLMEKTMVYVFDNDDDGYLDWVSSHPGGFIANMDRKQNVPKYPMAHLTTHKLMTSVKIGNFTTGDYIKFCSSSLEELDRYAVNMYGRPLTHCSVCMRAATKQDRSQPFLTQNARRLPLAPTWNAKSISTDFSSIFRKNGVSNARGKYLSRVFGIFSEDIVKLWASDPRSPYEDLGRPTIKRRGENAGSTLDFTLRDKSTGKSYVAELKCEIEYRNYKYFVLTDPAQLDHHTKPAFFAFLGAVAGSNDQQVFVNGQELQSHGAILIWGIATEDGRQAVSGAKGFHDVLTIADMVSDLNQWGYEPYRQFIEERREWANELFDGLLRMPSGNGP